jgi:hypothetical protein
MSATRPPLKPVALELRTFGDTPAAIYLAELLNQRNDPLLARKTAKVIAEGRELISDLARAHLEYDAISTRTFARLLPLISAHTQTKAAEALRATDPHIANLAINVLEGGLKVWKNRVQHARRSEKKAAKELPPGVSATWVPAGPLSLEVDSSLLRRRSKKNLARKGKTDSLY